jgi:serralysin
MALEAELSTVHVEALTAAEQSALDASGKPLFTLQQVIAQLGRYNEAWPTSEPVKYGFMTATPPGMTGVAFAPFTEVERGFTRAAFDLIADVCNLTFVEVPDSGVAFRFSDAIMLGKDNNAESFEWGHADWRSTPAFPRAEIERAQIWLNPDAVAGRAWIYGGHNFKSLLHEILHTLSLPHPGDYNANGSAITYAADAEYFQDSRQYTVMSYFDPDFTGADFVIDAKGGLYAGATPLLHDVAILQAIYGANTATRTGDTVYGFNSNAGRVSYDFSASEAAIVCIWDGGGIDTLDLSGSNLACRLDLNQGAFSDAMSMTLNISIAYGVDIENAKGGSANDGLTGNALANSLFGLAGDDQLVGGAGGDFLDGGDGADSAVYGASSLDFAWFTDSTGAWKVVDNRAGSPDGTDTLANVERLAFTDGVFRLTGLTTGEQIGRAFEYVLRKAPAVGGDLDFVNGLSAQVTGGQLTLDQAYGQIVQRADASTSVATMAYSFFVGTTPSKAGLDYLVSPQGPNPNNINSAYYQSFSLENRYINFAVNLGKLGEGQAAFSAEYAGKSLFEATRTAYHEIFGTTPDEAKLHALLDPSFVLNGQTMTRAQYFAYYGVDDIGTKAAMVGWLMAEAVKADVGTYALSNTAYLLDLADGAQFRLDLVGVYGDESFAYPA